MLDSYQIGLILAVIISLGYLLRGKEKKEATEESSMPSKNKSDYDCELRTDGRMSSCPFYNPHGFWGYMHTPRWNKDFVYNYEAPRGGHQTSEWLMGGKIDNIVPIIPYEGL